MDIIEQIKLQKENIRKDINKELNSLKDNFKTYVSIEHEDYPKYIFVEGICTRINYGCKENRYFWCYLPNDVLFIHLNKIWRTNMIFYDNQLYCWFVYNRDIDKYVSFDEMDTDSQIKMLENLKNNVKL